MKETSCTPHLLSEFGHVLQPAFTHLLGLLINERTRASLLTVPKLQSQNPLLPRDSPKERPEDREALLGSAGVCSDKAV